MKPKQWMDDRNSDHDGLPMFVGPPMPVRSTDPDTSFESAHEIVAKLSYLESMVFSSIARCGEDGATAFEVQSDTGLANETCTPRFAPLRRKGVIVDSGERRKGGTGRKQIVWRAR
jgi:hypothetical protein